MDDEQKLFIRLEYAHGKVIESAHKVLVKNYNTLKVFWADKKTLTKAEAVGIYSDLYHYTRSIIISYLGDVFEERHTALCREVFASPETTEGLLAPDLFDKLKQFSDELISYIEENNLLDLNAFKKMAIKYIINNP